MQFCPKCGSFQKYSYELVLCLVRCFFCCFIADIAWHVSISDKMGLAVVILTD